MRTLDNRDWVYLSNCLDTEAPCGVPASLDLLAMFFSNTTIASSLQLVPHVPQGIIWLGAQNFK